MQQIQRSRRMTDTTSAAPGDAAAPVLRPAKRSNRLARLVKGAAVAASLAAVTVAVPTPAQAATNVAPTNFGCSQYHHVADYKIIPIYTGSFCAYIGQNPGAPSGQGLIGSGATRYKGYFNAFSYRVTGTPTACNFWVDLDLYQNGRRYFHSQGTQVQGCTSALGSNYNRKFRADYVLRPSSQACATVWKWSGTEVVRHAGVCAVIS